MSGEHDDLEDEALRWLKAAFPPHARLDSRQRADTWRVVLAAARACRPDIGFPDRTLGWLTVGLALMAAWLAVHLRLPVETTGGLSLSAVAFVLLANALCLPVAAFVIVRRKRTWHIRTRTPMSPEPTAR